MKLTIRGTTFDITSFERQRDLKLGFCLVIHVPRASIGADALHDLLSGTEAITLIKDDGAEESYEGFNTVESFEMNANEYIIKQSCVSEAMAQISLLKNRATNAEKMNVALEQSINNQNTVIGGCVDAINAHTDAINAQAEQVGTLTEMNGAQLSAIDSILTEVVPTIIELAVAQAVEAILATQKEAADEESEVIEE